MKNHRHPWNLRQIFGSQSVGCVAGSPRPEAGIATRIIPAQSSRRTFRGPSDADLATCRPADLSTCPIWVLDFSDSSEVSPAFNSKAGNFTASFSNSPRLPSQGPAIVRTSPPVLPRGPIFLNFLFPTENSEEPQKTLSQSQSIKNN
jgi:hypothetical protein